ncbi:unnamed protein product [Calicophoron daubneyi]|uniref:Uncharacterized protein n=1 Tax=Calicophoron daubneyi TaxID=300641 RepID=A0AAV2TIP1_CALDB
MPSVMKTTNDRNLSKVLGSLEREQQNSARRLGTLEMKIRSDLERMHFQSYVNAAAKCASHPHEHQLVRSRTLIDESKPFRKRGTLTARPNPSVRFEVAQKIKPKNEVRIYSRAQSTKAGASNSGKVVDKLEKIAWGNLGDGGTTHATRFKAKTLGFVDPEFAFSTALIAQAAGLQIPEKYQSQPKNVSTKEELRLAHIVRYLSIILVNWVFLSSNFSLKSTVSQI